MEGKTNASADDWEARVNPTIRKVELSQQRLFWWYLGAFCFAAMIFLSSFSNLWARFGANLILFPTIVAGLHVYSLNKENSILAPVHSALGQGFTNDTRIALQKRISLAMSNISEQVRKVIMYETALASLGTALWAYGDLIGKGTP